MMDLTSTIASFATSLTLRQRAPGYWSGGIYVDGDETETEVRATVLPGGDRGVVLPEGVRSEDICRIWSPVILRGAQDPEGAAATRFSWRGREFEVQQVMDRDADGNGKFWRGLAFRVRSAEAEEE